MRRQRRRCRQYMTNIDIEPVAQLLAVLMSEHLQLLVRSPSM